jgi:hypothetical protein
MLTKQQMGTGAIYDPERQEQYDLDCTLIDDPNILQHKLSVERKFVGLSGKFKYLTNLAKGSMALLPLAAYINPDFGGVENIVAGAISLFTIPTLICICYAVPNKDVRMIENEYKRRVGVLEQRLEELER